MHKPFGPEEAGAQGNSGLTGCSDSNWCTSKSITGYLLFLGNAAVAWASKKQPSTALSSSEAETFAAAAATAETLWARGLMGELGWPQLQPTTLWMDNAGAVKMAQNAESVGRSRHISRRANFLQEASAAGLLRMQWLSTDHLAADHPPDQAARPSPLRQVAGLDDGRTCSTEND